MRVVYNTIQDDIVDVITKAQLAGRTIKYIALSKDEFNKLNEALKIYKSAYFADGILGIFDNVKLVGLLYRENNN